MATETQAPCTLAHRHANFAQANIPCPRCKREPSAVEAVITLEDVDLILDEQADQSARVSTADRDDMAATTHKAS